MARDAYPSETQERFLLRMPDGMRDRLKAEAEANKRSMNAEIVARLDRSLEEDGQLPKVEMDMFYGMAAAVAEQTVTHMLHVWLNAVEDEGGKEAAPVKMLRNFLSHQQSKTSGAQPDAIVMDKDGKPIGAVEFKAKPRKSPRSD